MPRGRLVRSRSDRMIAGVCGGLAEHFGIDPVLVRALFVIAAIVGGGGALAYVLLWIVVPLEPAGGQPSA